MFKLIMNNAIEYSELIKSTDPQSCYAKLMAIKKVTSVVSFGLQVGQINHRLLSQLIIHSAIDNV